MFAGPGLWREPGTTVIRDGSALRMIRATGIGQDPRAFTHGTFVNLKSADDAALQAVIADRVRKGESRIHSANLHFVNDDANKVVDAIMKSIGPEDYALVVVDFESPRQWPWTSVEKLSRHAPRSTEIYGMIPTNMALLRMMPCDPRKLHRWSAALDRFFGTDAWRDLVMSCRNDRERDQLPRQLEDLYCSRLRALGWTYTGVVREVRRGKRKNYSMVFASSDPLAKKFVDWEADTRPTPQLSFI